MALNLPWVSSGVTASRWVSPSPFLPLRRDVFSLSSLVGSVHWHWPRRCHCSEVRNVTLLLSQRIWCCSIAAVGFQLDLVCFAFLIMFFFPWKQILTDMMSTQLPCSAPVSPFKSHWPEARRQPRTNALQSCSRIKTKPFEGFAFSGRGTTVNSVHRVLWLPQGCKDYAHGHKGTECKGHWEFPLPGDLPDPGIELESFTSPALAGGFFTMSSTQEAHRHGRSTPSWLLGLRWGQSQIIEHQKSESIADKQVLFSLLL